MWPEGALYIESVNSERSDECIDFTMMCVFVLFCFVFFFFVSVDNIWSNKNASIFDFSPSLKRKLNLVGTLGGGSKKNPKKNEGKTGFFTQNQFTSKLNFLYCYNSKTNRCKYLKFSPNVYNSALLVLKVIKKNPKSLVTIFFYKCLKFEFIRNMSKLRKFASNFVVEKSISRKYLKILPTTEIFNFSENFFLKCHLMSLKHTLGPILKTTTDLSNIKSFNLVELKPNYIPKFMTSCNTMIISENKYCIVKYDVNHLKSQLFTLINLKYCRHNNYLVVITTTSSIEY
ncbi:hypothetical protein AGLY_013751 [Aphis glycines]|uniref:Uncharacterized protein n=1 Tax=Aphis glycines TaxID=307491 RepID=A0A6G0T5C0_APHGL|nr:hypothetical protein AGLY_013751 [Aphis glycines]